MATSATPAYVLWLGPTGLSLVRALGREGVPVVALHHDELDPSTSTRYARVEILPCIDDDEEAWLSFLLKEGRKFAPLKAVLMVAADKHWLFVARHRRALEQHFVFAMPEAADILEWPTKPWQHAAAQRAGIPHPRTATPRNADELQRVARQVNYPCIIKPALSHDWLKHYASKLAFVRSETELIARGMEALGHELVFTVQEYIPAEDHDVYGLFCCLDRRSQPLGLCVSHKIRQFEPRFGCGSCSESVHEPRVVELGLKLLQTMGFHGIASVEFKRDPRDGEFKLMEANLRAPLMIAHAIDSGVNLPYAHYRELIGDPLPLQLPKRLGMRVGLIGHDYHAARFYRELGRLTMRQWLWSWLRTRDLHFAWDDLSPFSDYMHVLLDNWRRGKFRQFPDNFPTMDEWRAGEWDGTQIEPRFTPAVAEAAAAAA